MNKHSPHLLMKKYNSYLVSDESIEIIQKIRNLYSEGKNVEEVDNALSSLRVPISITVEEDEKQVNINLSEVIQKQGEAFVQLRKEMRKQREMNEKLLEQMKKQQEYIDHKLEARDQKLMDALNQSLEIRKKLEVIDFPNSWNSSRH